jgi:hypothetical protein
MISNLPGQMASDSFADCEATRRGMTSFELDGALHTNRSMIKIGG